MKRFLLFLVFCLNCSHFLAPAPNYGVEYHYLRHTPATIPHKVIPTYLDPQIGDGDAVEIQKALDQWNYALNNYLVLTLEPDRIPFNNSIPLKVQNGLLIIRLSSHSPIPFPKPDALAFTDQIGGHRIYLIRDRFMNDQLKMITMHELGHILGSEHTLGGLMYPSYYPVMMQCVDQITLENVAVYQHLPLAHLNWCYYGSNQSTSSKKASIID